MDAKALFKFWSPVILWVGVIFWMSTATFAAANTGRIIGPLLRFFAPHLSDSEIELIHGVVRKLAHITEYFMLGLLLFRALRGDSTSPKSYRWAFYSLCAVAFIAAGDEFHQTFVATRTGSIIDVGIDTLGGLMAQCVLLIRSRVHRSYR